jgi:hypothetical protein
MPDRSGWGTGSVSARSSRWGELIEALIALIMPSFEDGLLPTDRILIREWPLDQSSSPLPEAPCAPRLLGAARRYASAPDNPGWPAPHLRNWRRWTAPTTHPRDTTWTIREFDTTPTASSSISDGERFNAPDNPGLRPGRPTDTAPRPLTGHKLHRYAATGRWNQPGWVSSMMLPSGSR